MTWSNPPAIGYEYQRLVVSGQSKLYVLVGFNGGAFSEWLQVFDATSTPMSGTIPVLSIPVDPYMPFSLDLTRSLINTFNNGIYIAVSDTGPYFTQITGSTFWFNAETG